MKISITEAAYEAAGAVFAARPSPASARTYRTARAEARRAALRAYERRYLANELVPVYRSRKRHAARVASAAVAARRG